MVDAIEVIGVAVAASLVDAAEVVVVVVSLVRYTIAGKNAVISLAKIGVTVVISLVYTIGRVGVVSLIDAIKVVAKSLRHLIQVSYRH